MPPAPRTIPPRAAPQLEALMPDLLRLATYLLRDRPAAEDMVQDIVLRLWTRMLDPKAPPIDDLRSYAFTSLRNRLRDRRSPNAAPPDALADAADPRAETEAPARLACAETLAALAGLPEDQATLIRLRAIDGLSYEEIATRLDLAPGTVTSRLSRARASLRDRLDLPAGAPVTFLMD
ncbi:RNA polymerase sigma factor [Nioella nitratireducens]|uniref:RNA polymerase sigma factor n=1 Tax=Nioella nitratireducens TaxID=1287720 RepID=UPI0008FCF6A5|nr:sigma-70 family RNA polymerase sigma factor [Nioella nitratireducens]